MFDSFRPFISVLLSPSAANPVLVKVRNAQKLQSLWNEDATRRQARMSRPLDDEEEVVQTQGSDEQVGVAENAAETVPRLSDEHLDIDSEFRSGKGKFKNWPDVVKIASEVHLDEMKALLETGPQPLLVRSMSQVLLVWRVVGDVLLPRMHYEDVIVNSTSVKKKTMGTVYAAIKHAHRHGLNVKIKLPAAAKEIFRKPSDED